MLIVWQKGRLNMDRDHIATWRWKQIERLLELSGKKLRREIRKIAKERVEWPGGGEKRIGASTLYRWLCLFKKEGYQGLLPKEEEKRENEKPWEEYAIGLLFERPTRSLSQVLTFLEDEFPGIKVSRSTLYRRLEAHPSFAEIKRLAKKERTVRGRYETDTAHQVWQMDGKGPFVVKLGEKERKAHLLSVIEDYSRKILAIVAAKSENAAAAIRVFRKAAAKYGIPEQIQFDKGSAFDSDAMRKGLGQIGTHRNFVRPRHPQAQGKIEAFHRLLKNHFIAELRHEKIADLTHLEQLATAWVELHYNQRHHHRELKCTPAHALGDKSSERKLSYDELVRAFLVKTTARSHRTTGELILPIGIFQVPAKYAGGRLPFLYDPAGEKAYLIATGEWIEIAPFQKKKVFRPSVKNPGRLQRLVDQMQGQVNAEPGFGLPEIFQEFGNRLGRVVPLHEKEAALLQDFYKCRGPFGAKAFREAIERTFQKRGTGRALSVYLEDLKRQVEKEKP